MLLAGVRNWLSRSPESAFVSLAAEHEPQTQDDARDIAWTLERIGLAGRLWGEGFILPGGEEETLRLARPMGLSAASSLLLLGCGPGGASRVIASRLGVWVSGFETDPDLVAAGVTLCAKSGLGKRAQVDVWNPDRPNFQHRYFHHAIGLEPMREASPETVLAGISLALRPAGQLSMLELVASERVTAADRELSRLIELERRPDAPVADVSERHIAQVVRGWKGLVRMLAEQRPDTAEAARLVREGEMWMLRARLLRSGRLRFVRWHAMARRGQSEESAGG
jgi:SAM-dependent methyltransferase